MAHNLPEDILYLICDELHDRRDWDTLFNCCTAGKQLAIPALTSLYKVQHISAEKFDSSYDASNLAEYGLLVQKWSILWRTIILSASGKTIFPYCKYIKALDLENLGHLLDDDTFKAKLSSHFFSKDLSKFHATLETPRKWKGKFRGPRLDVVKIVESIGDTLVDSSPSIEAVAGQISTSALVRWLPKLPHLQSLRLWQGEALSDDRIPNLLHVHCPKFEALEIYTWAATNCDQKLAAVFSGLPEHTLTSFTTFSTTNFGAESALALNCHSKSLVSLDLQLTNDAMPHLGFLKGCTALKSLVLTDILKSTDLQATQNDVFLEVVSWLTDLRELKLLALHGFISGAAVATPVLLQQNIRLEQLALDNYAQKDQKAFHQALAHQPSLKRLNLQSESLEFRDDIDILVHSLCQLKDMRALKLPEISAMFSDSHISAISENLPLLEDFHVGGLQITDSCLESLVHLRSLRNIAFSGITTFTMEGLLNFISKLGPGNQGLVLAVDNADPDQGLSEDEQAFIRTQMYEQIGGSLEYTFIRDPDISEFEGESD